MQKNHPETPKSLRLKRLRKVSTPELGKKNVLESRPNRTTSSRHRATMAPSDFLPPANKRLERQDFLVRRRIAMDHRASLMPNQTLLEGPRPSETEEIENEIRDLYEKQLQSMLINMIRKRQIKEGENLIKMQLATLAKEYEHDVRKLFNLKTRDRDITNLTTIQNEVDEQLTDADNSAKKEKIEALKNTLCPLYSHLKTVDKFRFNNVILPETSKEWSETEQAFKMTASTLNSITDIIKEKGETYHDFNTKFKDFSKSFDTTTDELERRQKTLSYYQLLTLKAVSLSLPQCQDLDEI